MCSLRPGPAAQPIHTYQHSPQRHCFLLLNTDIHPTAHTAVCVVGTCSWARGGSIWCSLPPSEAKQTYYRAVRTSNEAKPGLPTLQLHPRSSLFHPLPCSLHQTCLCPETAQQQLCTGNAILSPRTPPAAAPTRAHFPQNRFF